MKPKGSNFDSFHSGSLLAEATVKGETMLDVLMRRKSVTDRELTYDFFTHFHPYVHELVRELIEGSVGGLQAADTERTDLHKEIFTEERYTPTKWVGHRPVKDLDFEEDGAYSVYNWELFYHLPLTVAIHLSRNQRFEESQRWFHHVFDPTDSSGGPTPERFWKVKPFRTTIVQSIEKLLVNLATGQDKELRDQVFNSIGAWKDAPFRPHSVARYRQSAFMYKAVMAYLDNLIDWGDSLFRQDTGESINEATQLYVLAANILGPRPQAVPRKGWQRPQTYAQLRSDLDAFGNAMRAVEADIPFDLAPPAPADSDPAPLATIQSAGAGLYFCIPRNDKLLGYWDKVADRLFKIRNSLNIQGVFRQLPLFEPPIDPAMLARAAAAGLDVGAIVSGLNQPLPLVRFESLVGKAIEICSEVKSLGGQLLAAIEKEDAEALAAMRARHERVVLGLAETVRYQQWQEAIKNREGLEKSLAGAAARYAYYERQLGREAGDVTVPELEDLDAEALAKMKFKAEEPEVAPRDIEIDIASDLSGADGKMISSYEAAELDRLWEAHLAEGAAQHLALSGEVLAMIPTIEAAAKPMGAGAGVSLGGLHLSAVAAALASGARIAASELNYAASKNAKVGAYARRDQEHAYQSNLAAAEITQTYKQLRAAQIREAMAEREWRNHQKNIEHAEEIERFLTDPKAGRTTTKAFYTWLRREVRGLYSQSFQFAFEVAKKAERALQHELGDPGQTFIQPTYMSGKEGLLAGEKLHLDVKRMELAYSELNQREYELTKHVSVAQLNPVALLELRATGSCTVELPEELFDLDCPGHYFRRISSVAVSVPCVVGPYASVNCTLTLLKSSIRKSPAIGDGYARTGDDAERFSDHFGGVQSIVTSSATNDPGVFEASMRDGRRLPFERSGAISEWRIDLPGRGERPLRQFDYDTIADVILHLRYTAREGGEPLGEAARANLWEKIDAAQAVGSQRLFSVRHEFPSEWATFTGVELTGDVERAPLTLTLREEHYPFWAPPGEEKKLKRVELYARPDSAAITAFETEDADEGVSLVKDKALGMLVGELEGEWPATGPFTRYFDGNALDDLWVVLTWGT